MCLFPAGLNKSASTEGGYGRSSFIQAVSQDPALGFEKEEPDYIFPISVLSAFYS